MPLKIQPFEVLCLVSRHTLKLDGPLFIDGVVDEGATLGTVDGVLLGNTDGETLGPAEGVVDGTLEGDSDG